MAGAQQQDAVTGQVETFMQWATKRNPSQPEFLQAGPHRRVPLLVLDDGTQIGEAMAICRYFETLHPEPSLMGADALERATIEMWERTADNDGMNAVGREGRGDSNWAVTFHYGSPRSNNSQTGTALGRGRLR